MGFFFLLLTSGFGSSSFFPIGFVCALLACFFFFFFFAITSPPPPPFPSSSFPTSPSVSYDRTPPPSPPFQRLAFVSLTLFVFCVCVGSVLETLYIPSPRCFFFLWSVPFPSPPPFFCCTPVIFLPLSLSYDDAPQYVY